jgi:hypothetical protein
MDRQHINLLLHTENWRLNRGRVPNRVSELKGELQDYFQQNNRPDFAKCFEDEEWLFSRHFSAHEPFVQVSARLQRKCVTSSDRSLDLKETLSFKKSCCEKKS